MKREKRDTVYLASTITGSEREKLGAACMRSTNRVEKKKDEKKGIGEYA